jgi:TonB family protein
MTGMKRICIFVSAALAISSLLHAQDVIWPQRSPWLEISALDIPSEKGPLRQFANVNGVDLRPYVQEANKTFKEKLKMLGPQKDGYPLWGKDCTAIEFVITQQGIIQDVKLDRRSGDETVDEAIWKTITLSSPLPPLPPEIESSVGFILNFGLPCESVNPSAVPADFLDAVDTLLSKSQTTRTTPVPFTDPNPAPIRSVILPMGGITPAAIHTPDPTYTPQDGAVVRNGTVLVSCVVSKNGDVHQLKVLQRLTPAQDEAVRQTIATWKFQPATRYGRPIDMPLEVRVTFNSKPSTIH